MEFKIRTSEIVQPDGTTTYIVGFDPGLPLCWEIAGQGATPDEAKDELIGLLERVVKLLDRLKADEDE